MFEKEKIGWTWLNMAPYSLWQQGKMGKTIFKLFVVENNWDSELKKNLAPDIEKIILNGVEVRLTWNLRHRLIQKIWIHNNTTELPHAGAVARKIWIARRVFCFNLTVFQR